MGLHPLLDSNSLAVTAKQHDSTYSSILAIIVCNTGILFSFSFSSALWAAVQPAKSLILGTSGLIDPPGPRLRPPDLYIIRKLSERRIRLSNNTNFSNVALNAKFITHATDIYYILYHERG